MKQLIILVIVIIAIIVICIVMRKDSNLKPYMIESKVDIDKIVNLYKK